MGLCLGIILQYNMLQHVIVNIGKHLCMLEFSSCSVVPVESPTELCYGVFLVILIGEAGPVLDAMAVV